MNVDLLPYQDTLKYKTFLKKIYKEKSQLVSSLLTIQEEWRYERIRRVVLWIEKGEIRPGDIVYCTKKLNDIIFLEKPSPEDFARYHKYREDDEKYAPFSGDVRYKTLNGELKTCSITYIVKISKGNYFSEYEIKGRDENSRDRLDNFYYSAKLAGFRVEKLDLKNGYILRIYGDSQQEVDDFVINCFQNDLTIF